ncbi:MAG: CDP-diacylglycerol--serine O-phosphatidyltransferase, partial [Planctomycetaceae bacterium]
NVETDEEDSHEFFSGLPSPAAGGVVASLPIGMNELKGQLGAGGNLHGLAAFEQYIWSALVVRVPLVTLSAAVLMVSRLKD